jgi:YD repeat-containing protein
LKTVSEANTGVTTYDYDPAGNLASVTQPNGVTHAYAYNTKNQLTNVGVSCPATPLATPPLLWSCAYTLAPTALPVGR